MSKQLPPQPRAHVQQRPTSSPNPNLLDFSSKSPPSNSFAALNPNIQPQRRGRPNRDSINSKQGPLPTPPSIPSPAPTVTAPRAQLQVTGDRSSPKPKAPTPSGSLDAFGMPTAPRPQGSTSSGFSDSFGANPNPNSNPKAFRPTSRFGRGLSNNSGFGDSFGSAPMKPTPSTSDVERVAPAQLEIPQSTSPTTTTQSSFKNGEDQEFESRYPSIETLSGSSATSNLISPLTSPPPLQSRPSMLGNMTGGDMKQPHQHLAVKTGGPQPRSTHVTGTAFARSPSPIKSRAEYFENQSGSQSQSNGNGNGAQNGNGKKKEVDLMTGEEDEQMGAPLIRRASSTFHQPSDLPPSRDGGRTPTSAGPQQPDSSDEDEGPESATAGPHEPIPSPNAYKLLEDESIPANEYKPLEESRSATLPPKDEMPSSTRSGSRSPQKQRPQTMYGYPSTSPTKLQTSSSPQKSTGGLPTPQPRPGHVRKGSINDIVSKFEGLNPPSNNSNKPKPVLKAKPAQLKKPTLDTVRAEGLQSPIIPTSATSASKGSIPPKPQKPISLNTTSRTTNSTSTKYNEPPKPDGYSRSSSGRSFPIVKPKPTFNNPTPTPTPTTIQESRGGSPDKQQSVNSLVARWNQGEINKKPVVKPKPVLP
jgi:AP2-associated kinase